MQEMIFVRLDVELSELRLWKVLGVHTLDPSL